MIPRCYPVVKKTVSGTILTVMAVFMDKEEAFAWAQNANEWYGPDHPLTPLTVDLSDALFEPRPFPVEALRPKEPPKRDFTKWPFD